MDVARIASRFPDADLAKALLPHAFDKTDSAHDIAHILRVWANVEKIAAQEGGDLTVLQAATLLHDCVWVDKASPDRSRASRLAAAKASQILAGLSWSEAQLNNVFHAIEAHSFSAAVQPETVEACVLQDADRLDAIGFIGVARCLGYSGERGAALYHPTDPAGAARPLDDTAYALDHFQTKLMKLGAQFQTETGKQLAQIRIDRLSLFYNCLLDEVL
ncbi:MAG: HD domain-containing protein [Pseudomonadota bacterium]